VEIEHAENGVARRGWFYGCVKLKCLKNAANGDTATKKRLSETARRTG
jgi:hypothetical protein